MFTEYQEDVIRVYRQKKASGNLPDNLKRGATTANLKAESVDACANRYLRQDERTLARYFEVITDQQGYRDLIKDADADDFKSVYQFLRGETKKPKEEVIELLAWLIDYQPRPYLKWVNERPEKEDKESGEGEKVLNGQVAEEDEGTTMTDGSRQKWGKKKITALITIVVSVSFAAVWLVLLMVRHRERALPTTSIVKKSDGACMT